MKKHTCSIYKDRPDVCEVYPFEYPEDDFYFEDCQYMKDGKPYKPNTSIEEQNKYCIECGMCCFFMTPMRMSHFKAIKFGSKDWWFENATRCPKLEIDGKLEPQDRNKTFPFKEDIMKVLEKKT